MTSLKHNRTSENAEPMTDLKHVSGYGRKNVPLLCAKQYYDGCFMCVHRLAVFLHAYFTAQKKVFAYIKQLS